MKPHHLVRLSFLSILVLSLFSCKKDKHEEEDTDTGFSQEIKNFVPQAIIDSMRLWGMEINEGKRPPQIEGIYLISPNVCTFDNSGSNLKGKTISGYKYRFYNQDNGKLTIKMDLKDYPNGTLDQASGVGAFLAGNGNYFTAFVEVKGIDRGVSYTRIDMYSGEVTTGGIKNFEYAIFMKNKGSDPSNKLIRVGASRIFKDADDLAAATNSFKVIPAERTQGLTSASVQ